MGALVAAFVWAPLAAADDDGFDGKIKLGIRSVDVSGSQTKYQEDINLDDGVRLFELRLDWAPTEGESGPADRVELDITNFGGDPFEGFHLGISKVGHYDFRYNRTKSTYFYEDVILPADLADVRGSTGGDFHTFDFDRVRDTAQFNLHLSPAAKLNVGFERFTKTGDGTTTLDIQRDEFELDKPVSESYDDLNVGFQYAWEKVTLVLEERVRQYDNDYEIFLPGASEGENTGNTAQLDYFFLNQPYEIDSNQHTVRLNARPNDRLRIRASAMFQELDLDVKANETSGGTSFSGSPFTTDVQGGSGKINRDGELFDIDASYLINDRVALVGAYRTYSFDQDGTFAYDDAINVGVWNLDLDSAELGVQASLSPVVTLSVGLRYESRDVTRGQNTDGTVIEGENESTDHDGYFASLSWRPSKMFNLEAEVENSSYDNPFTLTSPTDRERYRLRGRWHAENGFYCEGSWVAHRYENNDSGWNADRDQLTARVGYRKEGLDVSAGYSAIDADRDINQVIFEPDVYAVLYESNADFLDARLRYRANENLVFGFDGRLYDNSGTFGIERDDLRGWVEIGFGDGYLVGLSYRTMSYDEDLYNFDDYDADIAELSIGYRW